MKIHQIKYLNIGLRRFYTCCFNFFDCIMAIGVQFNLKYLYRRHNNFLSFYHGYQNQPWFCKLAWKTGAFKASVNIMFQLSLMIERKFNKKLNLDFAFSDEKEREREKLVSSSSLHFLARYLKLLLHPYGQNFLNLSHYRFFEKTIAAEANP